ncbi:hypothetical protein PInf_005189 [Phytophthora infestans]|nr:hypothetical protein PInf_005189 [Phytophthora infestans]
MPGMKDDYEYDAEGDVKMAVPQPTFDATRAPSLKIWRPRLSFERGSTHYILKTDAANVSDDMLVAEMKIDDE